MPLCLNSLDLHGSYRNPQDNEILSITPRWYQGRLLGDPGSGMGSRHCPNV